MTYAEKLKDPRWQKKRLEIMERDNWTCQICGTKEKTMHTHHLIYIKGREPWDYTDVALQCLCEDCNEKEGRVPVVTVEDLSSINTMVGCINGNGEDKIHLWGMAVKIAQNWVKIKESEDRKSRVDDAPKKRRRRE
jgi:hypothetical protein